MKRIEHGDLQRMGATNRQLRAYDQSDPLDIRKIGDTYEVEWAGSRAAGLSAQGVLDWLESFAGSLEEENI